MAQEELTNIWNQAKPQRRKKKTRREEKDMPMNINSLMDIMVIILVFLLKSYGEEPLKVQAEDLKVPSSSAELRPEDMTMITISQRGIFVNDKKAVEIKQGSVDKSQKQGGENALLIQPLFEELNAAVKQKKREDEILRKKYEPTATIIADQSTPYRLVSEVMYTAGQAELSQFKFAVLKRRRSGFSPPE